MTVEVSPDGRSSTYDYGASGKGPTATALVDRALERMAGQLDLYDAARNLVTRWVEQDSSLSHLLPDALHELEAREKIALSLSQGNKTTRAAKKGSTRGPRVGDLALISSGLGPTFYTVRKVHFDSTGKLTALTLSDPASSSTGQSVAIERITAVVTNILNTQE